MASFKLVLFSKKRKQHRSEIFVLLCFFSKHAQRTTDIRWRNTIRRTLIFILWDPLANRGHSISKWLLLNSCCFLKNANSTESRFLFCCAFFQNTHNAQLIRWRNTIHRTLIFILLDPLANRGHSISKWLLLNSCCFLKKRKHHRIQIFCFAVLFFQTRTTHNWYKMAEHYSQDSYLYFIRSIGQQRALYIKMASFNLVLFSKKRKQHRTEIFVLLCFFFKTHNAQLI